jgi:nitrogen fixation/metabolism regulation signal transduction histidine kinase
MPTPDDILAALRKPVAVVCRSLDVAYANPAFADLLGAGHPRDDARLGSIVRSRPALAAALTRAIGKLRAVGWTAEARWVSEGEDGRAFDLRATRMDTDRYVVAFDEVTHHLRLQEIQGRARAYLETVLNHLPVGVIVLDAEFRATFYNQAQADLFERLGVERTLFDVIGAPVAESYPVFDVEGWQEAAVHVSRAHSVSTWDKVGFPRAQPSRYLRLSLVPLSRQEEPASGAICITEDVTRTVSLEQELLTKERLALVGQVTIAVNHEINNPLAAVLGTTEALLADTGSARDQTARLEAIREGALRIAAVTRRLREIEAISLTKYVEGGPLMLDLHCGEATSVTVSPR